MLGAMDVVLRPAAARDADRLLAWRNDPVTRRAAFQTGEVEREEHVAWLERRLADPRSELYIAESAGAAVGQVRLDREDDSTAVVSVTVAPEARGRGLAAPMLRALASATQLGVRRLRAEVKPDNASSLRAFARAGYRELGRDERSVVLELELTDARPSPRPAAPRGRR